MNKKTKANSSTSCNMLMPNEIESILKKKYADKIEEFQIINGELLIWVAPNNLIEVCRFLKESELNFDHPRCLSGVDMNEYLHVVLHLCSINRRHKITIKVKISRGDAKIPSIYPIYRGMDWHERETAEMLGIVFEGHPDPRHLLLMDGFKGYPLRKDFSMDNN